MAYGNFDQTPSQERGEGRKVGTLSFFSEQKGYGIITPKTGTERYVVDEAAAKAAKFPLTAGMRLTFDVVEGDKGLNAVNLKLADLRETV